MNESKAFRVSYPFMMKQAREKYRIKNLKPDILLRVKAYFFSGTPYNFFRINNIYLFGIIYLVNIVN